MESKTLLKFIRSIENILADNQDLIDRSEEIIEGSSEFVKLNQQIIVMVSLAAKLKALGYMSSIPSGRLELLLKVLEKIIAFGMNISVLSDSGIEIDDEEMNLELERRVITAANASILALYIMASPDLSKTICQEGIIDNILSFTKFQLHGSIDSPFDEVNALDDEEKEDLLSRKTTRKCSRRQNKQIFLSKLIEIITLMVDFLNIHVLTDVQLLCVTSFCLPSLFTEGVSDLQLSLLKLISMVFSRYEKHRNAILDDVFASIFRFKSTSRFRCSYGPEKNLNISMFTALILHLIQSVVSFPDGIIMDDEGMSSDELMTYRLSSTRSILSKFLPPLISLCGKKNEGLDLKPLFDCFVTDILITLNNPFWPVSEVIVINLATTLVLFFVSKDAQIPLRLLSLEYFGRIVARLRQDGVSMQSNLSSVFKLVKRIREGMCSNEPEEKRMREDEDNVELKDFQMLQQSLLSFIAKNGTSDFTSNITMHFCIVQLYVDSLSFMDSRNKLVLQPKETLGGQTNNTRKKKSKDDGMDLMELVTKERNSAKLNFIEDGKKKLINEIKPFKTVFTSIQNSNSEYSSSIGHENAELISRYFSFKRSFYSSFNAYLKQILFVLTEQNIAIRSKALKCLGLIVEVDPAFLGHSDMLLGIQYSLSDCAASVREAAVDLVGKYVLQKLEYIDKYYDIITYRIMDSSVSVRKRIIRILSQICTVYSCYPKIPDIWILMIRQINNEEGVKKLVISHFQNVWFSPMVEGTPPKCFVKKVMNMIDFVAKCQDPELEKFDDLLFSILNSKEGKHKFADIPKPLLSICHQIVDCLVENVLLLEENNSVMENKNSRTEEVDPIQNKNHSERLTACFKILYSFAKMRPQFLAEHALVLLPYLCQKSRGNQIISHVAKIFELLVPLLEHSSDLMLAQLEEFLMKSILIDNKFVINDCLSCLSCIIKCRTHNYKLISDCFSNYFDHLQSWKLQHAKDSSDPWLIKSTPYSRRAMFTIGLMLKYFDFSKAEVRNELPENIKDLVIEVLLYFTELPDQGLQTFSIEALGFICITYTDTFFLADIKSIYMNSLMTSKSSICNKLQILKNLESFLLEEEKRNSQQLQEWNKISKQENLKEMNDVSSGMASAVIQHYLKGILESYIHSFKGIRLAVLRVIKNVIQQGLVHPAQMLPSLMCMSTDEELVISQHAEKLLQDVERKYPGLIHMKSLEGICLSYRFQKLVQGAIVRGYRIHMDKKYKALLGYFYLIVRCKKKERRSVICSMLKIYYEPKKSTLIEMLYMADNLALLPYGTKDEPHFLIHHIDMILATSGVNLLQDFHEIFLPENELENNIDKDITSDNGQSTSRRNSSTDISCLLNTETESNLLQRIPDDTTELKQCLEASYGYMLLFHLREHIKRVYSIKEGKILEYSPSKPNKLLERPVNQQCIDPFNPEVILRVIKEEMGLDESNINVKKRIVKQYLKFKEAILWFEKSDSDEESENTR